MARGNKGSEVTERLFDARPREHVPADADAVAALLATAQRHVASAESPPLATGHLLRVIAPGRRVAETPRSGVPAQ